jgi:hypothetical protein
MNFGEEEDVVLYSLTGVLERGDLGKKVVECGVGFCVIASLKIG